MTLLGVFRLQNFGSVLTETEHFVSFGGGPCGAGSPSACLGCTLGSPALGLRPGPVAGPLGAACLLRLPHLSSILSPSLRRLLRPWLMPGSLRHPPSPHRRGGGVGSLSFVCALVFRPLIFP